MLLNGRSDGAADKIVIAAMDGPATGGSSPTATAAATVRAVASLMPRNLIERDASLAAGDRLAQAVLHQLGQHAGTPGPATSPCPSPCSPRRRTRRSSSIDSRDGEVVARGSRRLGGHVGIACCWWPSIAVGDDYLFGGAFGPFGALFPLPRPARTIVALVMFTASRSAVSAMWA